MYRQLTLWTYRAGLLLAMSVEIVMLLRVLALYGNNRRSEHSVLLLLDIGIEHLFLSFGIPSDGRHL